MDLNFRFSNLIGSVYRNGDVIFSPDGNSVISPIGNKISIFDLKNNVSRTLCFDCIYNIVAVALNSTGSHMLVSNEGGHVLYINMSTETVIFKFRANRTVRALQFSPDRNFIAICRDMDLQIQEIGKQSASVYYPFHLSKTYKLSSDTLNCVAWSRDGCLLAAGGEDHIVRVVGARDYRNLYIHALAAHKGAIVTCHFMGENYDLITVCKRGIANVWTASIQPGDLVEGVWTKPDDDMESEDEAVTRLHFDKTKSRKYFRKGPPSGYKP
ncbi:unnamed protein product [Nippostrongylus brasiliensis]|uniref:Periodic tryptophan protein 2 homolog (inferred by orthology to a C. elegans protein) n=1 Tax=Nippostrongylus brasiliensis TaxID=27835 RepID=A0A0N4YV27_NIPBR|nr:unnamed protein product [Nippostrongylus brasiliensis]